jgi:nitroimidazol reductase NimA-like FMN-containing flavoprotein (pyridoxamine 5'-phosphate oxidase superfamily)
VAEPTAHKLALPEGYGRTTETLDWAIVRTRLEEAKTYWLATSRPDGRPHVVPVDGIWLDDSWFYGGSPETAHRRIARANPHAVMHLPEPFEAVMVEGDVRPAQPPPELAERLAEATNTKYADYGYRTTAGDFADAQVLVPRRVIAWSSFPRDATRFLFDA